MRQSLVKSIRRTAKEILSESPYVEYKTIPARISEARKMVTPEDLWPKITVMTDHCIKKFVKDTKRFINDTGQRL